MPLRFETLKIFISHLESRTKNDMLDWEPYSVGPLLPPIGIEAFYRDPPFSTKREDRLREAMETLMDEITYKLLKSTSISRISKISSINKLTTEAIKLDSESTHKWCQCVVHRPFGKDYWRWPKANQDLRYTRLLVEKLKRKQAYIKRVNKAELPILQTFDELFEPEYSTPATIEAFINVLTEVDPPIIRKDLTYIGHYKGAFKIWVEELKGIVISSQSDETYTRLLNSKFPGLNLASDGQIFRKTKAETIKYNNYHEPIRYKIGTIRGQTPTK